MSSFPLKIVTPDGLLFDGMAEKLIVRTIIGDMAVLAGHINCLCPLGMGRAVVVSQGQRRTAACIGGFLDVRSGSVTLVPTTFEWAEDIDLARAETAHQTALKLLEQHKHDMTELRIAEAKVHRALVRKSVAQQAQGR